MKNSVISNQKKDPFAEEVVYVCTGSGKNATGNRMGTIRERLIAAGNIEVLACLAEIH